MAGKPTTEALVTQELSVSLRGEMGLLHPEAIVP